MHRTKQKTKTGVWRARWGRTFCAFAAFFALTANVVAETVAKVGDTAYETLEAALAAVAEGKPLTWVSETAWPTATPVYYNGKFYKTETVNYAKKGALEVSIDAANEANANEVAKIYVRPGFEADELVLQAHQPMKTSLAIYGNGAKLSRNWEPCVELQGTDSDSSAHQLAKNVSLAIYNLHNGAGFWGRRATDYTVDLKLSGCENAHQVMFYGNADTSVKGKTDISVTNCTFDATQKGDHNVIVTIGAGTVEVSGTTFIAANINVKNVDGGDNAISVKDCTFKDTVAGNQNIRVRSYVEGAQAQLTVDNVTFEGASTQNIEIGDSKAACKGRVSYTISKTTGALNVYKQGATVGETATLDKTAEQPYTGSNVGMIADEKSLRKAFYEAPMDGTTVTITLGADITLETLYAAENFGTEKLADNAEGDTFNRYKIGVHPTEDNPNQWNPLVTAQTQEARLLYGAYYNTGKSDERIARLVVKAGQKIVLDLNGHTIQKNARATHGDWSEVCTDIIGNYGTLEVVDSSTGTKGTVKGIGYYSCKGAVLHNYKDATMTVKGVNIDGNAAGMAKGTGQYVIANDGGTLAIDGANVFDTAATVDASLVVNTAGTVTITGNATLNHPTTKTVNVKGGVVNVESATIISDTYAIYAKSGTVNVNGLKVSGSGTLAVDGNTATITKKQGVELPAPSGFMWAENDGKLVLKSFAAKVGDTAYETLEAAFAALTAENHTLTLLNENAWDAAKPVYWSAGAQKGYEATLAAALSAAYKADAGAITVVCRPGADVGKMTHGHVADDLTIYGNNAYISDGECDLEVDTYKFSRTTGARADDGVSLDKDITITAYELDNLGVWGQRTTAHKVTVNLTDCDGKALEGKTNVQRVYISGKTGVNDITLTDCDFITKATAVYSNADGAIKAVKCSFTGGQVPFNINHKADGTQTVSIENCTFTNCGDEGGWKQFAAPIRFVNSGAGTLSASVSKTTITGTVGANGDILLGDGRTDQKSNDVALKVVDTAANVQAQKPGYYNGETVDETKKATKTSPAKGTLETSVAKLLPVNDGTKEHPYSREQFAAMTRADYIAAQERLNGTLYVDVGDCSYDTHGVLGNGVRNDATGQTPDHSKLNAYGENGYLGEENDGANGKTVVFVGGTITSGVTGYTSIDSVGTSLLLAVPAYTKVTFTNTVFKNVLSFDYQLYTAPWSQLGGLAFEGCTFDGIIVGAIAAQELAFNGCTFNVYKNTTSANNSNPTWIRPAYGNWSKGDNEGQGTGFRSLTKIVFENNTVTSTRPVKFERIAQWEMATTVTATGNTFDIKPQEGDTSTKNVGLYFGANAKFDLVIDKNGKSEKTAALYTAVYSAPNGTGYAGLPAGSTVKDTQGSEVTAEDALAWKKTDKITLKTTAEVASVTNAKGVSVNFATLAEAIESAAAGETIKLLADTKENVTIAKKLTLDLNGFTLNGGTEKGKPALTVSNASVTVKDSSQGQTGTIKREDTAVNSGVSSHYVIDIQGKNGFLKFEGGNVTNDSGIGGSKGASLIRLGDDSVSGASPTLTITGGTFTQDNFIVIKVDRGTLYLKGGTVKSANSYAIENWNNAFIMGGTVNGTVSTWVYSTGAAFSELEISGGTVNGNVASVNFDNAADKQARVYVTGGTVTGTLGTYTYNNGLNPLEDTSKATIEVTGGTFEEDPTKYVVEDSTITKNEDGTFGVAKAYLAKVGETSYYTMDEAFHAVVADGVTDRTVVLLRNYTTGKIQNSGSKSWMLDLNGKTWTYTGKDTDSAAFEINYANVTLTVKNGKVVSASMLGLIPSASSMTGTITYDNAGLVFEKVEATANGHSGIETNGNNTDDVVTLKDSTLNVPNGYGIYFASSGKVTIENSIITAKTMGVQVCSGNLEISGDKSKIEVTGDAVAKTENDGAIEDGAAVSVVNRPGYKGLGTIAISGGTFKAKDGNAAIKAYTWENKTESAFDNANGTVAVRGGTFSTAVEEKYCAEGFIPMENADGTYGVKQGAYVAAIGETKYETLAKAIAAAKSGDTITLLADVVNTDYTVANAIDIKLASGVTLDGNGKTISGNVKVTVSSEGDVTIKDADFRGIHNAAVVSDSYKTKYGFSDDKVGTLSAIYAPKLAGALTILGCAFENCDWEAMQITPAEGAKIHIRDNVFKTSESDVVKEQLRHVHVEMAYGTGFDYEGTDIELAITDNQFHGETKEANMGVWWVGKASKLDVTGNYYENPDAVSITLSDKSSKRENRCDLIYPARSKADVDVDDLTAVALVVKDAFNATAYATVAAAIKAATDDETVRLLADTTEDVTVEKNITLDLNGKKLTNTGSSKATVSIAEGSVATVKNGSIVGGTAYYNIEIKKGGTATFEDVTATAGNTGSSMISNCGTLTINSGTYTGGLNVVLSHEVSTLTINGGTFELYYAKKCEFTGVIFNYGNATINGGTFIQNATSGQAQVVTSSIYEGNPSSTKVLGGTFTNKNKNTVAWVLRAQGSDPNNKMEVSGGTFNKKISDGYCAEGYAPKMNADGTYGVESIVVSIEVSVGDSEKVALPFLKTWLRANIGETETQWTAANLEARAANGWAKWVDGVLGLSMTAAQAGAAVAAQGTDAAIPVSLAHADADSALLKTDALKIAYVLSGSNDRKIWTKVAEEADKVKLAIPLNTETLYKYYRVDVEITAAE